MDSHDPHHLRDACQTDGPLLFYHDSLVEPLLCHSVRLPLFDIDTIIQWSYLRAHIFSYHYFSKAYVRPPKHPYWSILESATDMLMFIIPSGIFFSWWKTHFHHPQWSILELMIDSSFIPYLIISEPLTDSLTCVVPSGAFRLMTNFISLVTLVDHCWVTRADQYAYTF